MPNVVTHPASRQRRDRGARADGEHRGRQYPRAAGGQNAAELPQSAKCCNAMKTRVEYSCTPFIAVTDSPFPSLDPAKAALASSIQNSAWRKARRPTISWRWRGTPTPCWSPTPSSGEMLRQLTRCKAIGRFGLGVDKSTCQPRRNRHRRHVRAGLLHAGSLRPRHGVAAGAGPQGPALQQAGAVRSLGGAADRADPSPERAACSACRIRQHPARARAEGEGVRAEGDHARPYAEDELAEARRRRRRLRELLASSDLSRCTRRCCRRRAD